MNDIFYQNYNEYGCEYDYYLCSINLTQILQGTEIKVFKSQMLIF